MECKNPNHDNKRYPLYDCARIFVSYVCADCEEQVKSRYAPHVFGDLDDYEQIVADCGERIEED